MSKISSIMLGPHFDKFIAKQLESGQSSSTSEVVRAGLRMLEDSETKLDTLSRMLEDGEKSVFTDYSYEALISELDNEAH